jgi:multisubunit Na+/H+ antiporter MnhC subunit
MNSSESLIGEERMTKFGADFILSLGLLAMTFICTFLLVSPATNYLVKVIAGIALFDIAVVAFLLAKNW